MWALFVFVLLAVPFSTYSEETAEMMMNNRQRYTKQKPKSEMPLLLIRPINRGGSMLTNMFRGSPSSKMTPTSDDISMLGSILPQLGLDPMFFSAYGMKPGSHIHIQPVKSSHYYPSGNYYNQKSPVYHGGYQGHQNYPGHQGQSEQSTVQPHSEHKEHSEHTEKPEHKEHPEHHVQPEHEEHPVIEEHPSFPEHNEHEKIHSSHPEHPSVNAHPSFPEHHEIHQNHDHHEHHEHHEHLKLHPVHPINSEHHPSIHAHHSFPGYPEHNTHPKIHLFHQEHHVTTPNYKGVIQSTEHYFTPKPIDFSIIKSAIQPNEEVVIGKPHFHDFKPPQQSEFYVPKDEQTASFEVKSKTENVKFVPQIHSTHYYFPKEINTVQADDKPHYLPQKSAAYAHFKKPTQIEYFIPKEQESTTTINFHPSDSEGYYKKFDTEEYFLPKLEPEYHTMPPKESYSFKFNDKGHSNIHITEHIFSEHGIQQHLQPQAQRYTGNEHYSNSEYPNHKPAKHPNNHNNNNNKLYDTKLTAFDYVKSSLQSNLNKTKDPSFVPSSTPGYSPSSSTASSNDQYDFSSDDFFKSIKGHKDEYYYTTPKVHNQKIHYGHQKVHKPESFHFSSTPQYVDYYPTIKDIIKEKLNIPNYPLQKTVDVRPVFEISHDEITTQSATRPFNQIISNKNDQLYLIDRTNSNGTDTTTNLPSTKIEIRFPSKMTTPKITTYKQKLNKVTKQTLTSTTTTTQSPEVSMVSCERQCIQNTVSQEYDPVCGSDNKTYSNKGKLRCTRTCAKNDVTVKHYGACGRNSGNSGNPSNST